MKFYNTYNSTVTTFIFITIISYQTSLFGQAGYTQIQIGAQLMQSYNLGEIVSIQSSYYAYREMKQRVATTFNQDISVTRTFDQHHGVILGGGLFTTCRWVDATYYDDIGGFIEFKDVKACYKNYMLYFMYQYTTKLSPRWNGHFSAGPMWAKNHNFADWFYVPVRLHYFSAIVKAGVGYKISERFSVELNGATVRSFSDIVDNNNDSVKKRLGGSLIPLSVGIDLRVGYRF